MLFLCLTGFIVVTGDNWTNDEESGLSVTAEYERLAEDKLDPDDPLSSEIGRREGTTVGAAVKAGSVQCFLGEDDRFLDCIGGAGCVGDSGVSSAGFWRSRLCSLKLSSKSIPKPDVAMSGSSEG